MATLSDCQVLSLSKATASDYRWRVNGEYRLVWDGRERRERVVSTETDVWNGIASSRRWRWPEAQD